MEDVNKGLATYKQQEAISKEMFYIYLAPLIPYLNANNIQEIMVNGPNNVWIEEDGIIKKVENISLSEESILSSIKTLANADGRDVLPKDGQSIVDTRHERLRIAAAIKPTAVQGPIISIRKQSPITRTLDDYTGLEGINPSKINDHKINEDENIQSVHDIKKFLRYAISSHKNLIIAGGTSSGKTTFLKALIQEINPIDRTIVIEDTPEIASNYEILPPNNVCLESNLLIGISTRDLVKLSLRLRPDRIIVGEIRGAESFDLMQALNTGHDGGITSLHANSSYDALSRLETMVLTSDIQWPLQAIKSQIGRTFNYVVFMTKHNGKRGISEILKVNNFNGRDYETEYLWPKIENNNL